MNSDAASETQHIDSVQHFALLRKECIIMLKRKLLSVLLALVLVVSMAVPTLALHEIVLIEINELNDLNVRATVSDYMAARYQLLAGNTAELNSAIPAMQADELLHLEVLEEQELVIVNSSFTIDSVDCEDIKASVTLTETVVFDDASVGTEAVEHTITVRKDSDGKLIVSRDGYAEELSGFVSCSYVDPNVTSVMPASYGSAPCIVKIARGEIGYTETGTNITKYGSWYGLQDAWCVMFISWCANQANIPTTYIPKAAWVYTMSDFYSSRNRYYLSSSQGGTTAPQVGDIYFEGSSSTDLDHVGIIAAVDSNYIYIIEGNASNQVKYTTVSRTASDFVAFGRPQYPSSTHSYEWLYTESWHWKECTNCAYSLSNSYASHTLTSEYGKVYCTVCGYTTNGAK